MFDAARIDALAQVIDSRHERPGDAAALAEDDGAESLLDLFFGDEAG